MNCVPAIEVFLWGNIWFSIASWILSFRLRMSSMANEMLRYFLVCELFFVGSWPQIKSLVYAEDLGAALQTVKNAGGRITKETFSFPGGPRFQFTDPRGNELAVGSEI